MQFRDVVPLVGQFFDVPSNVEDEIYVQLTLTSASQIGKGHELRAEPFQLTFEGPSSLPLEQSTYLLHNDALGDEPIFIVPLSDDGSIRRYEAIFN